MLFYIIGMDNKQTISLKEQQILFFIYNYWSKRGYPPTVREIGKAVGLQSSCSVHYRLKKLEEKGFIKRNPSKPRAIEILPNTSLINQNKECIPIPLLRSLYMEQGEIKYDDVISFVPMPRYFLEDGDYFIWENHGDAIFINLNTSQEYLLIKCQSLVEDGEWVLVIYNAEVALVQIKGEKTSNTFTLNPHDQQYSPSAGRFIIAGKVVGILKKGEERGIMR